MSVAGRLLDLAKLEERLVEEARMDELSALYDERDELIAQLPSEMPAAEVDLLERAVALQRRCAEHLRDVRDKVAAELAHVDQGRVAVRGYAPAGMQPQRSVDATG